GGGGGVTSSQNLDALASTLTNTHSFTTSTDTKEAFPQASDTDKILQKHEIFVEELAQKVLGPSVQGLSLKQQQEKIDRVIQAIINFATISQDPKPGDDILKSELYQALQRALETERKKNKSFGDKILGIFRPSKTDSSDPEAQLNELEKQLKTIIEAQDLEAELDEEERALLEPHELEALNTKPQLLLEELELQMSKRQAKIKALKKKVKKRKEEIEKLEGELKDAKEDLGKQLQNAKNTHDKEKQELAQQLSAKEGMLKRQMEKIQNLEAEKNNLSTQKGELETQLQTTKDEKANLEKEHASLSTALRDKENEIVGLKGQAQRDSAEISTLKGQVSQKERQIRDLNTQNAELKTNVEAQTKQKQEVEAKLQALQQRYSPLDPLLNLQAWAHQSPTIAKRLEISTDSNLQDFFFSKLFKNPLFILEVIAKEIAKSPADQGVLIDFFETLFAMPLPGRLERLQVQEGDKFDPQMCEMRDTSQSTRGSVVKILFQGYKEEGKIKHKSLVDVR
uniref:hypothetical protein n=1 Tax=Helicobacter cynogastricus TaxID=329937 RepID=UPI0013152495